MSFDTNNTMSGNCESSLPGSNQYTAVLTLCSFFLTQVAKSRGRFIVTTDELI